MCAVRVLDGQTDAHLDMIASLGSLYSDNAVYMGLAADGSVIAFTCRDDDENSADNQSGVRLHRRAAWIPAKAFIPACSGTAGACA